MYSSSLKPSFLALTTLLIFKTISIIDGIIPEHISAGNKSIQLPLIIPKLISYKNVTIHETAMKIVQNKLIPVVSLTLIVLINCGQLTASHVMLAINPIGKIHLYDAPLSLKT
ncbi:MAG: hypothetical protein MJ223_03575 [Mycoplasmoidaceae bacterium]|nr:hypothetical protein [Mycoplasmoidaceae bacterium]